MFPTPVDTTFVGNSLLARELSRILRQCLLVDIASEDHNKKTVRYKNMDSRRVFRFAHAGVLVALLYASASTSPGKFDNYIWIPLALALPATVFRGLIADHPEEDSYRAVEGLSGWISFLGTIAAFAFTFANYSIAAAIAFVVSTVVCVSLLMFGKRKSNH